MINAFFFVNAQKKEKNVKIIVVLQSFKGTEKPLPLLAELNINPQNIFPKQYSPF